MPMKSLGRTYCSSLKGLRWSYSLLLALALFISGTAKSQELWSEVQLNKTKVYVGEPVEVSIFVYTSTWFTSGVDPGNIKVNNASTVYFRSVSTSKSRGGKTYSGVQMIFNVFPFEEGSLTFPSIKVEVETPPDGGYKGVSRTVSTKERVITVKPIPPGFDPSNWLVTSDLSVRDNWSGDLAHVKVGDVVERRLSLVAQNTIAALIPTITWDSIPQVSLYPKTPSAQNNRTKTSISASSEETVRYLFEQEGEVTIPKKVIQWWHPYQQKLYKRTLPAKTITVGPNPDLGIVASIKDSLAAELRAEQAAATEAESPRDFKTIAKKVAAYGLGLAILIFLIWKLKEFIDRRRLAHKAYLESEEHYFKLFLKSLDANDEGNKKASLYAWLDRLNLEEPSLKYLLDHFGDKFTKPETAIQKLTAQQWKEMRRATLTNYIPKDSNDWINP